MSNFKPIRVVTAAQMRDLDTRTTTDFGIPGIILMENAGRAVFDAAVDMLGGNLCNKKVLVACGPGNNGGDGFVAARYLLKAGADPTIAYYGDRSRAADDALENIQIAEALKIRIEDNPDPTTGRLFDEKYSLIIDALLGTGARGRPKPPFDSVIDRINELHDDSAVLVLSVDTPSAVDSDTGTVPGNAIAADVTVTFALPKIGLVTYPGASHAGSLIVADIGIPASLADDSIEEPLYLNNASAAAHLCKPRSGSAHKGVYGHVAIVGGSAGMTGAATLAATGALRIGAGLVTVLAPESLNDILEIKLTEAMTISVPEGRTRAFGMDSLDAVMSYVNKWDAAVIGPGIGRDDDTVDFTLELLRSLKKPAIIDADALYAVAQDLDVLRECKAPLVMTPHPGEMATLLGTTSEQVQSNRLDTARAFAKENNVTVVLKGAGSVIASPGGRAYINPTGTPGMASGGTGDVLSGMIGGLLAQEGDVVDAVNAAVYLHGLAGEIAAAKLGEASMLASDLAGALGEAIARTRLDIDSWKPYN